MNFPIVPHLFHDGGGWGEGRGGNGEPPHYRMGGAVGYRGAMGKDKKNPHYSLPTPPSWEPPLSPYPPRGNNG